LFNFKETMMKRKLLARCHPGLGLAAPLAQAQISGDVVKIGFITDMSGLYADIDGPGSVKCHQDGGRGFRRQGVKPARRSRCVRRPPEQGRRRPASKAREWFDTDGSTC
jgi:branched-chain amino acid transport system substrate-binding protein